MAEVVRLIVLTVVASWGVDCLAASARTDTLHDSPRSEICLNGAWLFHPGVEAEVPKDNWTGTLVPQRPVQSTCGWYRLVFRVPDFFCGRTVKMRFDRIGHYAKVFLNAAHCGEHYDARVPFEVDITDPVKWGEENNLLVFVHNASGRYIRNGPEIQEEDLRRAYRTEKRLVMGVRGDVSLICHPSVYVEDAFVVTSYRQKEVRLRLWMRNEGEEKRTVNIRNSIREQDKKEAALVLPDRKITIAPNRTAFIEIAKEWENPRLWGYGKYGDPVLYFLSSELREAGKVLDTKFTRFGFRELWAEGPHLYLNRIGGLRPASAVCRAPSRA